MGGEGKFLDHDVWSSGRPLAPASEVSDTRRQPPALPAARELSALQRAPAEPAEKRGTVAARA